MRCDDLKSIPKSTSRKHISGRLLVQNTFWNLLGQCAPILVALVTIPLIIRGMGTDRYGVLTLAWMIMGYFSLFDMGLGRALTKLVAECIGTGQLENLSGLIWTALFMLIALGLFGGILLAVISPWLISSVLKIPAYLSREALYSFYLIALSIPFVICSTGLRGVLEAQQSFKLVNSVNGPMGILFFIGPVFVLHFTNSLVWVVFVLLCCRVTLIIVFFILCIIKVPGFINCPGFYKIHARPLLSFGGWMTISNLISPLMVSVDRFVIGAMLSVSAVAYYATPFDMAMRILIIPSAITTVLFPAFTTSYVQDPEKTKMLYWRGMKYMCIVLLPTILVSILFAENGLKLWLGPDFSNHSTRVTQWLLLGVLFNGIARFPFTLLQGIGKPDLIAKIHIFELVIFLPLLYACIKLFQIQGAGVAWMLRAFLDALIMASVAYKCLQHSTCKAL
jgi:O-antigen/teichoic acid export membrane protein